MDLFYQFLATFLRFSTVTACIYVLSSLARHNGYGLPTALWFSPVCAALVLLAYQVLIYPFIDPLRKLPLVDIADIRLVLPVTDVPRGESALEWTKQYQDHDAIRIRVMGSSTAIMPISVAALRDLFGTKQQDFAKPDGGRSFLARILGYGLILSEGQPHTRQRKQLTTSFRIQNIRALHGLMLKKTDILLRNMETASTERPDGAIDITTWASKVTLDIIGPTLMSQDFDSLNVENQPVHEAFGKLTSASPGLTFLFALSILLPQSIVALIPIASNATLDREVKVVRKHCEKALEGVYAQAKEAGVDSTDVLASIIADPLASRTEVVDQMVTFLGAGHETTATSIAWITHLLTLKENIHYQDKLREEIQSHPDCTDSSNMLETLPWLNAICEETLRLFPPVTSTARKAIRDTTIAGTHVAKDTMITVFPWAINRNPLFWGGEDAEKFIPERWLDTLADGSLHVNNHGGAGSNYCNMTFLQGNRSCIGKGFAKAELRLVIAKMFGTFRVSRLSDDDGSKINAVGSLTIKPEGGLFVKLERV